MRDNDRCCQLRIVGAKKQTGNDGTTRDNVWSEVKDDFIKGGGSDGLGGVGVPHEHLRARGTEEYAGVQRVPREGADGLTVCKSHALASWNCKHGCCAVADANPAALVVVFVVRNSRCIKCLDCAFIVAHKCTVECVHQHISLHFSIEE